MLPKDFELVENGEALQSDGWFAMVFSFNLVQKLSVLTIFITSAEALRGTPEKPENPTLARVSGVFGARRAKGASCFSPWRRDDHPVWGRSVTHTTHFPVAFHAGAPTTDAVWRQGLRGPSDRRRSRRVEGDWRAGDQPSLDR